MELNVAVSGAGPDLVLLHGWGMDAAVWDDLIIQLAPHFRVHNVALPGYGSSPACTPYTLDAIVDALTMALPPRASVCGWSLGGQIALAWAMRHPAQVERLALIATTPRFVIGDGWDCAMPFDVLESFVQDLERDCVGTLQRFVALQARNDTHMRTVLRRLRETTSACGHPDMAALIAGLRLLQETDMRGEVRHIMQPVLIIHGERDTLAPLAAGAFLQRTMPRASMEIFPGCAHAPFIAQSQRVARHMTEFCGGC
jgi:pimeloyl-[acyl-carrier protein] methyl ester esterase